MERRWLDCEALKCLLYTDWGSLSGHTPRYITGLAGALRAASHEVLVAAPVVPDSIRGLARWVQVPKPRFRSPRSGLAFTREILSIKEREGVELLWDLEFDRNSTRCTPSLLRATPRVHSVQASRFMNLRSKRSLAGLGRGAWSRLVCRLASQRGRLIVHSGLDFERLQPFCATGSLLQLGWPVCSVTELAVEQEPVSRGDHLLFVGGARPEKGLEPLLEAMKRLPEARLVIAGAQPQAMQAELSRIALSNVTVLGEVQDDSLHRHYRSCAAAVIPYTAYFEERGGTSGVLAEALRWGCPVIATRHMRWCFSGPPPEGIVWASSATPADLEAAIREFLARREELTPKAAREGPRYLGERHTYDGYVAAMLDSWSASHRVVK